MAKILLLEDDRDIAQGVTSSLNAEGHNVFHANTKSEAVNKLAQEGFELFILDWELPDGTGLDFCKQIREKGSQAPVLFLTGKALTSEKEEGLDSGADDYLTKPFQLKELKLRVQALLRRANRPLSGNVLTHRDIVLDPRSLVATKGGVTLQLVRKEFALLEFLMRNPEQIFSLEDLMDHVWTADEESSPETLRTHIKNLRKKIDVDGEASVIETVHGFGYRLAK